MPFQSEKQRRYLHANHPEIAKRWERDYAGGGRIPAHQAGIYGLAEGGRTGFFTGMREAEQQAQSSGGNGGYQSVHDTGAITQTPGRTTTPEPDRDGKDDVYQDQIMQIAEQQRKTKEKREQASKEGWHQFLTPKAPPQAKKTITVGGTGVNLLTFALTGGIDNPLTRQAASKLVKWGADKIGLEKTIDTFVGENFGSIYDMKKRIEERVAKEDLIQSLPKGHPERIQLEGLTKETITPERDNGGTQETGITYDDIEDTNKKELASSQWRQKQKEVDRSKQMAYWRMMMAPYMSAQGGRVPGGYNTGGLSNLFRLKNR